MEFFRRAAGSPSSVGILSGTFNPPTRAHLALAQAALQQVEEIVFALPRIFPHKEYQGATFDQRLAMLEAATRHEPRYSIAAPRQGLFIDIARECRGVYGLRAAFKFLCGRDAAERIVHWDYGSPGAFLEMLDEFELLVASRRGSYQPPPEMRARIHPLPLDGDYDEISATEVRERIRDGRRWEHLVPEAIVEMARRIYC